MQSFKYLGNNITSTNRWVVCGLYAMSLDFKRVGIVIICLRINATKVILNDGSMINVINIMVVQVLFYGGDCGVALCH